MKRVGNDKAPGLAGTGMTSARQLPRARSRARTVFRTLPAQDAAPSVSEAMPCLPRAPNRTPPFAMPQVVVPVFAARMVSIVEHGAIEGGQHDCTAAIARAIASCAQAGGGRVLIPPGQWLTGPIHLRSNIELHLSAGAVVRFISEPQRYLPPVFVRWSGSECYNYSPLIYARDCTNIAITGGGTLLGQGRPWWPWEKLEQRSRARLYQMILDGLPVEQRVFACEQLPLRPQFILPINCTNVLMEDFTIGQGGPFWTVHVAYCQNVTIRRVRINAPDGPNNDGIDIDSSRNVIIEDCELNTGDDCVALKSGMNEDGWRVGKPTENVIIRRIRATGGQGGIAIGSEMSGGVRNVFVHDCHYDGPAVGIRMKAARGRGGIVENIHIQDITMGKIAGEAIQMTTEYPTFARPDGKAPIFRHIHIRNIACQDAKTAVRMIGLPDAPFQDIRLENIAIAAEEGLQCAAASRLDLVDLKITPRRGPVLSLKDGQEVLIHGLNSVTDGGVFLDLRGRQTRNIRLSGRASEHARPAVVLGIDVPRDALMHEHD